ncbi:hypothetical protein AAC387_Pa06g1861 [Persea americana]
MKTLMSLRTASPVGAGRQETHPLGNDPGEGTSGGMTPDIESALRGEVFQLSKLVKEKEAITTELQASFVAKERDWREELWLRDAIIDVLADTYERDKDLATSEAVRIRLEGELQTLRAGMARLQAKTCGERDRALAERDASKA